MDIRLTTIQDLEQVKSLWAYCFENHEPFFSWYFREYYQGENTLGAFEKDRLLSSLQLIPYNVYLRGQVLPTSYIVGVASFPEARRAGTVGKLLVESLAELRRRGHAISLLMPFKASFYYPYQFEFCYHHYKYDLNLDDLKPVTITYGDFLAIKGTDNILEFNEVYQEFVSNKHGFIVRDTRNWRLLLEEHEGEKGYSYLLKKDEKAEGYIMYYLKDDKMTIREMAYSNQQAQMSLFQFIYNHRSQVKKLEWIAPLDDTTCFSLADPKEGISLYSFLTARIVDVESLLTKINYPAGISADLVISVADNWAPWNNNKFRISVNNGQAVVQITKEEAHISIDIGALTLLIFGRLSVWDLLYKERLALKDNSYVLVLESLFPPCNNYINEYY
ncbi:MAG: hypothetical protein JM58_13400 [Peptococcaceae bacterium BICA1-8]|nr:MAG: hypothetical protein JM58_13400 [Peptococcaceae bacterium BICA1-8]